MADTKISGMTSLTQTDVVTTTDVIPIVDIGPPNANKKITPQALVGASINNLVQTWNAAPTTFTGLKLNITDTASAASSLLMDLQVGGSSKVRITKAGLIDFDAQGTGFYRDSGGGGLRYRINGTDRGAFNVGAIQIFGTGSLLLGDSGDIVLTRDAADTLAQRRSTNAQTFRIYETYTDPSNYSRGFFRVAGTIAEIGTEAAGSGTVRPLYFSIGGATGWFINTSRHFLAGADNTYDIGASGANRPRDVYVAGTVIANSNVQSSSNLIAGAAFNVLWTGRSIINSPADGIIRLLNNAGTDFSRLQFGGTTSSFPALRRNAAALEVVVADNSAWATLAAGPIQANGNLTFTADNTYDIGQTSVNRPRNVYIGGAFYRTAGSYSATIDNSGFMATSPSGVSTGLRLGQTAWTDFNLLLPASTTNAAMTGLMGALELRNGVNAQTFRVYNTYTDASNYERLNVWFSSNVAYIETLSGGTGTPRNLTIGTNGAGTSLRFMSAGVPRWRLDANGHLTADSDNTYDIGASGATRPRNLYLGGGVFANAAFILTGNPGGGGATSRYISGAGTTTDWYFNVPTGGTFYFATAEVQRWRIENTGHFLTATDNIYDIGASGANRPRNVFIGSALTVGTNITMGTTNQLSAAGGATLSSPADGIWRMTNNANTDFNRLQFGGTTSSFPSLKRSGAEMHVRLADDSAFAKLISAEISSTASLKAHVNTAIPAGGTAGAGVVVSSTSNFGVFFGSGAPTLSAAKGSLYLRSDGTTTNDRMYVNTNGSTTWTAVTTAA